MGSVNFDDETRSVISDVGDIGNVDFANDGSSYNYDLGNDGPIVISAPFPLTEGKPQFVVVGETIFNPITIENTTSDAVTLWSVEIYDSKPKDSFTLSIMKPPSRESDEDYINSFVESFSLEDRTLLPGKTLTVWLSCKSQVKGLHTTAVHFNVGDDRIERMGFIMVEDKVSRSLTSNKPYNRPQRNRPMLPRIFSPGGDNTGVRVIRGSRPTKPNSRPYRYKLPEYRIPKKIRDVIQSKEIPDTLMEGLSDKSYVPFFNTLITMEEIKLDDDMRIYDMQSVTFKKKNRFLTLQVPGLSERRPSLVTGDFILAKPLSQNQRNVSSLFRGSIFRVEAEDVILSFPDDLYDYHSEGDLYDVQFEYNRLSMRRLYQAIEASGKLDTEFLFPEFSTNERFIETSPLVPISCNLNEEQLSSVEMILGCKGGPPYVVHGPPGTGKSVTLTEVILQLYKTRRNTRILVCAPSNSAADHMLERLTAEKVVEIRKGDLLRLNASSRSLVDMKTEFLDYCCFDDKEMVFNLPIYEQLLRFKIIISTYASAALLYAEGLQTGHFTHIFLDEAAQASEPETMIPISHFYRRNTVVVLAGDPLQLGPVIFSKDAESYGLGKSYMERLCDSRFYNDGNQNYVTKLVRNYRCHQHILSLPSQLFYKGELVPCKEDDTLHPLTWKDDLPNPEFPVLFLGVQGVDEREGNNPSWFNRIEVSDVVEVITNLKAKGIKCEDIGVITPYRQQVLKITQALETFVGSEVKVGTVEAFQGQEREVIIISTVRSTIKHNETDKRHCLGFLSNPRRFNVAITRAKSLLIAIGNPHIICKDEHWNKLLWHCADNDSYKGCFCPEKEEMVETEPEFNNNSCNWNGDQTGYKNDWANNNNDWGTEGEISANNWVENSSDQTGYKNDWDNNNDWGTEVETSANNWVENSSDQKGIKNDWDNNDWGTEGETSANNWAENSSDQTGYKNDWDNNNDWGTEGENSTWVPTAGGDNWEGHPTESPPNTGGEDGDSGKNNDW